jgi:hypothetical protein
MIRQRDKAKTAGNQHHHDEAAKSIQGKQSPARRWPGCGCTPGDGGPGRSDG